MPNKKNSSRCRILHRTESFEMMQGRPRGNEQNPRHAVGRLVGAAGVEPARISVRMPSRPEALKMGFES